MDINTEWHARNMMPKNPTLDQRVKWHLDHVRHCSCHALDGKILEEIKKRYLGKHQEFWIFFNRNDHRNLALWAADCAEHVLPYFEEKYPEDSRPRDAIRILREWIAIGNFSMSVIRGAALASHAAARGVSQEDNAARYAARAAGQAVATAHVPTHAIGSALYALKAIAAKGLKDVDAAIANERDWQKQRLPENLQKWVNSRIIQSQRFLPDDFRTRET